MSNVEVLIVEGAAVDALTPRSIEIGEVPTLYIMITIVARDK
jgi:hypothetical protein